MNMGLHLIWDPVQKNGSALQVQQEIDIWRCSDFLLEGRFVEVH